MKKMRRFNDKIWIGERFLEDNVEQVPEDLSMAEDDTRTDAEIILDGVTALAKAKLAQIPVQDLLKTTSFLCPVCSKDGRTQLFERWDALLQHLSTTQTRLPQHHQGYAKAFKEILGGASDVGGPSAPPPMEVDLRKRPAESVVWPPVLFTHVRNADHKHVLDKMLEKQGVASQVHKETLRLMFGRLYMVVFEASVEGFQQMSTAHDQLEKECKGRRDWEAAKLGRKREPLGHDWLFGYAAEERDMAEHDKHRQKVEWHMVPYDEAVTKDFIALKKRRAREKDEADFVMDELEEGARRIREAEDWLKKMHVKEEKIAAKILSEYDSKREKEDRALAEMEWNLQLIKDEKWRKHGGQLKFVVADERRTLDNQDGEDDLKRLEKELMAEEMRRCMSGRLLADQIASERLKAFEAREEEETLKIQRYHDEMTQREMEARKKEEEEVERQMQLEVDKAIEEQQKEVQKMLDVLEEKKDELDYQESLTGALTAKQRAAVDKVKELKDACIKVWEETAGRGLGEKRENVCGQVYVKMAGSIEDAQSVWKAAWQKRLKADSPDWEVEFFTRFSAIEKQLRDTHWYPFKLVDGNREMDESDETLVKLEQELGTEVKRTVVDALLLLETYNASGRFPMPVFWNLSTNRPATWAEIYKGISLLKAKKSKKGKR